MLHACVSCQFLAYRIGGAVYKHRLAFLLVDGHSSATQAQVVPGQTTRSWQTPEDAPGVNVRGVDHTAFGAA